MLHKSFKPAKCKTSLKLATSRMKLMKNKKGVQINQMKRDLAQLLESGQDRTARIRVEHVIREEKMVAAYDLIEIYCELIVARLAIIESQKTCPIDLKEAVTSVIFAAPRCSDVPELVDIRKHFTAKYGKEFVSAALELRPDCGVSRMLVEKLSAVAPDVQTKVKVLSAVAIEHNIKWDPTSFEEQESKRPSDLLNGPANFGNASMANADPPKIQASNMDAVHSHEGKQDAPFDLSQQNRKYTLGTQNIASTDTGGVEASSAATHADMRPSGTTSERTEIRQPVPRSDNDFSSGRQNWNMGFKDATSAAQAAAESAEQASMAARAAARLSGHGKVTNYLTESHESNIRDETPHVSAPSEFPGQGLPRDSYESSSDVRKPKILNQQMDRNEHDTTPKATERFYGASHGDIIRSSRPASFTSNNDSIEDEKLVNDFHTSDGYFQGSLHEDQKGPSSLETSTPEGFKESKAEFRNGDKESPESENFNYFAEEATKEEPSISSSHSHSSTTSDELDVPGHQKFSKISVVGNPFAVVDQGNPFREATKTSSNVDIPRDDEAISDDDDGPRFDMGFQYDEVEAKSYFPSPDRESPIRSQENAHIWSPRRNRSNTVDQVTSQAHLFSESRSFAEHSVKSVEPSETDDHIPVNFDHSDGPDSESESELAKSSFSGIKELTSPNEHVLFSTNPEPSPVESSQNFNSRKSRIELNDLVERESSFYNPEDEEKRLQSQQSSSLLLGHEVKKNNGDPQSYDTLEDNNDSRNQSNDLDTGKELNFGTLTGGLRNKGGLRYPPYTKSAVTDAISLSKKSVEESSVTRDRTSPQSFFNSRVSRKENKEPSVFVSSDSDSDDYNDTFPVLSSQKGRKQADSRSRFSPSVAFFDDDATDSEEEVPKQAPSRVRLGLGLSRRTKGSPSAPYSKSHVEPKSKTVISSSSEDRKPSRYSYSDDTPAEPRSYTWRFMKEDAKQIPESQAVEQPFIPSRKTEEISSTETQQKPSRRSYSNATPSEPHVHPANIKQEAFETMAEPKIPAPKPVVQSLAPPRKTVESGKTKTANNTPAESRSYTGRFMKEDAKQIPESLAVEQPFIPSRKTEEIGSTETQQKPSRRSYSNATPSEPQVHATNIKQEAFETMAEPKIPAPEPVIQSLASPRKIVESGKTKTANTSNLGSETSSGESVVKKPSHVHPKLPDYDSLAARLQSLRTNRQ